MKNSIFSTELDNLGLVELEEFEKQTINGGRPWAEHLLIGISGSAYGMAFWLGFGVSQSLKD